MGLTGPSVSRKHISLKTKLASALLALGHISHEDAKIMSADQIVSLYQFDHHPILHSIEPIDDPWNLTPRLIADHRKKSAEDTRSFYKSGRLSVQHEETRRRILAVKKRPKQKRSRWGKRSLRR